MIVKPTPKSIQRAISLLRSDEPVGLPTETVYGLAANAYSDRCIERVFSLKSRPKTNPLIVHITYRLDETPFEGLVRSGVAEIHQADSATVNAIKKLVNHFWPGPLTLVLPKNRRISNSVTAGLNSVGVRMPNHPVFQEVLRRIPFPLAAPSANLFCQISPTSASDVAKELPEIKLILDGGPAQVGLESSVVRISTKCVEILRPGIISAHDMRAVLPEHDFQLSTKLQFAKKKSKVSPGLFQRHYSPRKRVLLLDQTSSEENDRFESATGNLDPSKVGLLTFRRELAPFGASKWLGSNERSAVKSFYSSLRFLDEQPRVEVIVCERPPTRWKVRDALIDRMEKAAGAS